MRARTLSHLATLMTATLGIAAVPSAASARPADWARYVLGPATSHVTPVRVVSTAGQVSNAQGLVDPSHGPATLSYSPGGKPPVVLLDYGKDVGGLPYFQVNAASGAPTLRAAYSEAEQFAGPDGDGVTPLPRPGLDTTRHDDHRVSAPGTISETVLQGGERFQYLTLTTPGSVTLRGVGIEFTAFRATPEKYQGWFLSSDDQLNRIWYAGAYTAQLDMAPVGSPDSGGQSTIFDGAKRDRGVWSGDLLQTIPTIAVSLGGNGTEYIKQSLALLARHQNPSTGQVPGVGLPTGPVFPYSASYSTDHVLNVALYYRYTGDRSFIEQQYPVIQRELAYDESLIRDGLLSTRAQGLEGLDWDIYDGAKSGAVTAFNAIYYRALTETAGLAAALHHPADATQYRSKAAALRRAINQRLFNTSTGVYDISSDKRGTIAQDANVLAISFGIASAGRVASILRTLREKLWIAHGSLPFSSDAGYSPLVSPYIGGFELAARFGTGDTAGALALLRKEWGPMISPGPRYTGAFWENLNPDGSVPDGQTSLAHGWSSGPTSALSQYVLGVQATSAGYRTWTVAPHPGDLTWARGQVPTPAGPITVRWTRSGSHLTVTVQAPAGTRGTVIAPPGYTATVR
jgi:hypothetical protein